MPKKTIEDFLDESLNKEIDALVKKIKTEAKKLSPKQLKILNQNLVNNLIKRHKFTFKKDILKFYKLARNKVLKNLNQKLVFTSRDEAAVKLLRESKVLAKIYSNMDARLTNKINKAITDAIEKDAVDFNKLVDSINKIKKTEYSQADLIARTEHGVVTNIATANTYKTLDEEARVVGKYHLINPLDTRTTHWCAEIVEMTKNGVTLKELEQIIKKYGDTQLKYRRPFQIHLRCRSTISPI